METPDPLAALQSKDISDRAAGCRDLSLMGTVENLEVLAELAAADKSPGVRLNAAAAAADILSRCRNGEARAALSDEQRDAFVSVFGRINPAVNAGVFPIMACLDHAKSRQMIFGGLRDPQADVRLGAAVGLMRLCSSVSTAGTRHSRRRSRGYWRIPVISRTPSHRSRGSVPPSGTPLRRKSFAISSSAEPTLRW